MKQGGAPAGRAWMWVIPIVVILICIFIIWVVIAAPGANREHRPPAPNPPAAGSPRQSAR